MNRDHSINDKLPTPLQAAWKYVIDSYKSRRKRLKLKTPELQYINLGYWQQGVKTEPA